MNTVIKSKRLTGSAIIAYCVLACGIAYSDDTEIFEALPPTGADNRPNVLLIMDTSGSMDGLVVTQVDWDPNATYAGDCDENYIYWQSVGSNNYPSCTGNNQHKVSRANFVCQAADTALATVGQATHGQVLQWDDSSNRGRNHEWESLDAGRDSYVECKDDHPSSGTQHGKVANDGLVARNNSNSHSSGDGFSTSNAISNWGSASYTFYTGKRLNYLKGGATFTRTRLEVVQQAAKDMLDQLPDGSVNVGLMRFENRSCIGAFCPFFGTSDTQGGYVLHQLGPIENVRGALKTQIDGLNSSSWTPLTETLFEAFRYYTGGAVLYGNSTAGTSVAASRQAAPNTNTYLSPMANSCQTNYVVLLTDGEATKDSGADSTITSLTGFGNRTTPAAPACSNNVTQGGDGDGTGVCLDDLAQFMWVRPDIALGEDKIGKKIQTYTIGFGPAVAGSENLKSTAELGGGKYYPAGDSSTLAAAFSNVLRDIISTNVTFTSPTISVNAFNRTRNLDELFFTVFQPDNSYHWPGNIKKYRILSDGELVDAAGNPAVDPTTGFFAKSARSFWSAAVDGDDVKKGGAAHKIPDGGSAPGPNLRNVFTDVAAYTASPEKTLSAAANAVSINNAALTGDPTLLGLASGTPLADIEELITWARGQDDDGTQTYKMGDPLHARPAAVVYGGTAAAPDVTVFAATNDGYLHAINGSTGVELWSFIPSELLSRLQQLRNNGSVLSKEYGLDGSITVHQTDINRNGIVDGADKVLLFFGMGRGGSDYYALDVTNRSAPTLLWRRGANDVLIGGGETWSTPSIATVRIGATVHTVMIVAGGYDSSQDSVAINTDDKGNRIFMLDALTGTLLWHAGPTNVAGVGYDATAPLKLSKMLYSIPSEVRVIDTGADGFADRMYVGDMGGQVWRFDIHNGSTAANLVTGGVIATLGAAAGSGGTSPADARRFYAAPDVALIRVNGQVVLNIAIGSGYRGHPMNKQTQERFYSIRDTLPLSAMNQTAYDNYVPVVDQNYTAMNLNGMYDLTTLALPDAVSDPVIPVGVRGWKIELRHGVTWKGEKVMSESRTFANTIYFTSFAPNDSVASNSCTVASATNKLYAMCASGNCRRLEFQLQQAGIAPEPVVVRPPVPPPPGPNDPPPSCVGDECAKPVILIGAETLNADLVYELGRIFWKSSQ